MATRRPGFASLRIRITIHSAFCAPSIRQCDGSLHPEDCTNGIDDNGDGDIDCLDRRCAGVDGEPGTEDDLVETLTRPGLTLLGREDGRVRVFSLPVLILIGGLCLFWLYRQL